jgi:hypothetical protein
MQKEKSLLTKNISYIINEARSQLPTMRGMLCELTMEGFKINYQRIQSKCCRVIDIELLL